MAGKEKESRVRRWTKEEVEKFVEDLANPLNGFAFCLDLALKKSSNNEVYTYIQKSSDEELTKKQLIEINKKNNTKDKSKIQDYKNT